MTEKIFKISGKIDENYCFFLNQSHTLFLRLCPLLLLELVWVALPRLSNVESLVILVSTIFYTVFIMF